MVTLWFSLCFSSLSNIISSCFPPRFCRFPVLRTSSLKSTEARKKSREDSKERNSKRDPFGKPDLFNPGPQFRDNILIDCAVFQQDVEGVKDFGFITIGDILREDFKDLNCFLDTVGKYLRQVVSNHWTWYVVSYEVYLYGWRVKSHNVTDTGKVIGFYDLTINIEDHFPCVARVRVLLIPNMFYNCSPDVCKSFFELKPAQHLRPSPPLRPAKRNRLGVRKVWCPYHEKFCCPLGIKCELESWDLTFAKSATRENPPRRAATRSDRQ